MTDIVKFGNRVSSVVPYTGSKVVIRYGPMPPLCDTGIRSV